MRTLSPPRLVRAPLVGALILVGALANLSAAQAQNKPAPAPAPSSVSERQARADAAAKAFLVGRYEEALAIYADLYVQRTGGPSTCATSGAASRS